MKVTMFQKRFAPLVESGVKRQTIRPRPQRVRDVPNIGEVRSLREWTGKPYRSKQRELCKARICTVALILIGEHSIMADCGSLPEGGLNEFARADGFKNWSDMRQWFQQTHGLPFSGMLIQWEIEGKAV